MWGSATIVQRFRREGLYGVPFLPQDDRTGRYEMPTLWLGLSSLPLGLANQPASPQRSATLRFIPGFALMPAKQQYRAPPSSGIREL
jgi:hypothetical protein